MDTINDCHVHLAGNETVSQILKGMDKNKVDKAVLFNQIAADNKVNTRRTIDFLANIVKQGKKRLYGFIRINPLMPGAAAEIERGILELRLHGVKMLPDHWYPYEKQVQKIYKVINALEVPILFHSGILWGFGDSSRFCRPAYYECMINYPKVKFALAHIGWPWTDECLAVAGRFAHGDLTNKTQMYVDITTGAPKLWKIDAMRKMLSYLPHSQIMYGSDMTPWTDGYRDWVKTDFEILAELGATNETIKKVMYTNFKSFVK